MHDDLGKRIKDYWREVFGYEMPPLYTILVDGVPTPTDDIVEWGRFKNNPDNSRVAETFVKRIGRRPVRVSTVFLGVDHGFFGPPLWFETMVFNGKCDQHQWRYTTLEQAMQGHEHVCAIVRGEIPFDADA